MPVYPGYVCSILASILLERPVKWIEDKTGNLISTGFARDVYLDGEMALRRDGKILAVRMHTDADHGAFFSDAQPSKFKIGLMHSAFAAYDIPVAHLTARGMYTNKAPGGVAYRCSFRVTEAMFFQERMVQAAADDLGMDQAAFRRMNFVRDDDFPHRTPLGFLTDSGQYAKCLDVGLKAIGYEDFRREQAEARQAGPAARPRHLHDDRAARRGQQPRVRHPRHQDVRLGRAQGAHDRQGDPPDRRQEPGPGARDDLGADRRARARHPGRRHRRRGRRHRHRAVRHGHLRVPVHAGGRRGRRHGRPARSGPRPASWPRTCSRCPRRTSSGSSAGSTCAARPTAGVTIQECAMAAYSNMPDGMEPGLENTAYYDPPNLTWPFAVYIVTVEVDPETGVWDVLNMVAVDDCGVRINPMIVEGQIMGGLTEAYAMASMQFITFDADGNCVGSNYMDYLLPTAWETPGFELHSEVVTPCPHHPIGAKGIGECAAVGGPAAFVNAVIDALVGHRGPQYRHAAAARPGVGGDHLPPRRLRRAAGAFRRLTRELADGRLGRTGGDGRADPRAARRSRWRPWSGARARRRASRARARSSPPAGELHGWIGGACAEPVVIREAQQVMADGNGPAAAARHPGPVRRGGPGRHDRGPDLLPERGRARGLHRAGAAGAAPGDRRRLPDGPHAGRAWPGPSAGATDLVRGPDFTPGRADERVHDRRRHPGP